MKKLLLPFVAACVAQFQLAFRPTKRVMLSNIAEGQHDGSLGLTRNSDVVITERFLLAKEGATPGTTIAICTAADIPLGVITDEAAAIGDPVNVQLFNSTITCKMVASAAIAVGAWVEPAAAGRVQTLGVGVGTHYVVGKVILAAGAAGEVMEVIPANFLRVI